MNRKKFIKTLVAGTLALALLPVAMLAQGETTPATPNANGKRILIAYFSWSGNTKSVAETIAKNTGGELFEIVPETPYPENYRRCTEQAKKEITEGFRPKLKFVPKNLASADIVFVGSPNWWGTYAPPIATLLDDPAFEGKTIVPFFTHGGGGLQRCESDMKNQLPQASFLKAFTVNGSSANSDRTKRNIANWLLEIGVSR